MPRYSALMSQDMDATEQGAQAAIRLREAQFDAMTSLLGYVNDTTRAELIGVWPKTVRRAREGIIGEQFIAKTVAALAPHAERLAKFNLYPSLNDLFEVVPATSSRAA